jgi:hypothetical protein
MVDDLVLIKEEINNTKGRPRFSKIGTVVKVLGNDTYRIEIYASKKKWKRHTDQLRLYAPEGAVSVNSPVGEFAFTRQKYAGVNSPKKSNVKCRTNFLKKRFIMKRSYNYFVN